MNRRRLIKNFGIATFGALSSKLLLQNAFGSQFDRFILIGDLRAAECHDFLTSMTQYFQDKNPLNIFSENLTQFDIHDNQKDIERILSEFGYETTIKPTLMLIRIPSHLDHEKSVETWTPQWLQFQNERALIDGCYPVSGGWWSVEGDFNPTLKKVRDHLFKSPNHTAGKFTLDYLSILRFEELQSLHSDHHREMVHQGLVAWDYVNKECPTLP